MARGNSEQQGYGLNNASYTLKDNCNLYFNLFVFYFGLIWLMEMVVFHV